MQDVEELDLNLEGNIVREKWKNSGFTDDFNRVTDDLDVSPELVRNLIYVGTASALQQTFQEVEEQSGVDMEPFNVRAIGVFAHLYDEHGDEVFETWTENSGYDRKYRFGDIDMYFPAGRETKMESRPSIEEFYSSRLGGDIGESANGEHLGDKYTAHLDFAEDMNIEMDLIRPEVASESDYPAAQEAPVEIETEGGAILSAPPLEECILHKGTLERDNGDGHDTMRDKDYRELASLLHIAEEREIEPEHFEDRFEDDSLEAIGTRAAGIAEVPSEWDYQPSDDYISRIDQWQHIYSD